MPFRYNERRVVPVGKEEAIRQVADNVAAAIAEASRLAGDADALRQELNEAQAAAADWQRATEDCEEGRSELRAAAEEAKAALSQAREDVESKREEIETLAGEILKLRSNLQTLEGAEKNTMPHAQAEALQRAHEEEKARLGAMVQQLMQERDAYQAAANAAAQTAKEAEDAAAAGPEIEAEDTIASLLKAGLDAGHWTSGTAT